MVGRASGAPRSVPFVEDLVAEARDLAASFETGAATEVRKGAARAARACRQAPVYRTQQGKNPGDQTLPRSHTNRIHALNLIRESRTALPIVKHMTLELVTWMFS